MSEVVVTEFMDEAAVRELSQDYDVFYDATLVDRPDELTRTVADCRALIVRNRTQVRGELLTACARLEAVGRLGVGLDNIDVEACRRRGIDVLRATGANDLAVAEYVIAGLLMLFRGAYFSNADLIAGTWPRSASIGREVSGKHLGLIGFGGIAREVAARAKALGMSVSAYDPFVPADAPAWQEFRVERQVLDGLIGGSDAISLHIPLTDKTRNLIDREAIAKMKRGAIFVNSARGSIVDEKALVDALQSGKLGGAMLDVFEREPLKDGSFFNGVPNLVLTPHIAGVTEESNIRVSAVTAENVRRVLEARR